jgi:hypothetical protein
MAKKATAKKAPAKRKPAAKKPVDNGLSEEFGKITSDDMARILDSLRTPAVATEKPLWRQILSAAFTVVPLAISMIIGVGVGVSLSGGIPIGPGPQKPDAVSAVFDAQESEFRSLSGERAKALQAGEIKSEADSAAWMSSRFIPQAEAAWVVLLTEEAKAFGGEQWTAEKEAAWIERYVR